MRTRVSSNFQNFKFKKVILSAALKPNEIIECGFKFDVSYTKLMQKLSLI